MPFAFYCMEPPVTRAQQAAAQKEGRDAYREQLVRMRACFDRHRRQQAIMLLAVLLVALVTFGFVALTALLSAQ
jgi:hypothetical protein